MEFNLPIQACQSLGSQSWGYRKDEDYYTSEFIISSIDKILAMGGSYLLNVGPCSDGSIANEYWKAFSDIGSWYKRTKDAFSETYSASYLLSEIENNDSPVLLTREENDLYVHFPNQLSIKGLVLKGIKTAPKSAIVINNGQKVEFRMEVTPSYWNNIPYLHLKNLSAKELKGETMIVRLRY
jgi:alpha-L-fucosidase